MFSTLAVGRRRRRVRRLYHRQCREQSDWPLISAAVADHLGLAPNFYFFAALNLAGAALVYYTIAQTTPMMQTGSAARSPFTAWITHTSSWCAHPCRSVRWSSGSSILSSCRWS
jgi:hypothetical protein